MDPYSDIRPYNDAEVAEVLPRLLADPEFLAAIAHLKFPWLPNFLGVLIRPLIRAVLKREVANVTDVGSLQTVIEVYMSKMIEDTSSGFSVTGLEELGAHQPYLYMSNHRDITMDPAFTNYALFHNDHDTARIAIGDNLLTKPFVSDLMRLNKSFIVNRSATAPRQILKAYRELSAYIRHSIIKDKVPVWMAQREGRAKDGIDRTEPAIIKMLAMSKNKGMELGEHIAALRIVPVAISYELDPCDALKAAELFQLAETGSYEKDEHEDVASIAAGIAGNKGQVHMSFGTPLGPEHGSPEEVAEAMDRQIIENYALHATNIYAYRSLHGEDAPLPENYAAEDDSCSEAEFAERIAAMPEGHRPYALAIYANAVVSKLRIADAT
jgi:hypothetical protein